MLTNLNKIPNTSTVLSSEQLVLNYQNYACKNSYILLLERHFHLACKYATLVLNKICYSDLINYSFAEVNSYVFICFDYAIKKYKYNPTKNLSFKNYLYMIIKFRTFTELKTNLKWQVITNWKEFCHQQRNEQFNNQFCSISRKINYQLKFEKVLKIVSEINPFYKEILLTKIERNDIEDFCLKHNLTRQKFNDSYQYIRKLILKKYKTIDEITY